MKTTKLLLTSAVATALFPLATLSAIDDQGMQYVSAAEGLHGSLRVHILHNEDKDPNDGVANSATDVTKGGSKESLRLWITGSGDIGNEWATTYYWEVRDGSGDAVKADGTIGTEAWDVGIKGPFGSFNFGKLGMVAPRMVPGGSLDTVAGGNAQHFASDPGNNGLRFESAAFRGFQFGISGTANGVEIGNEDDLIDEYSVAVKYTSPLGFQIGAGYEVDVMHDLGDRFGSTATRFPASYTSYDDKTGWRVGARYGQDNWLLGYEFRSYKGLEGWDPKLGFATANDWINAAGLAVLATATSTADFTAGTISVRPTGSRSGGTDTEFLQVLNYQVHRAGVQVKLDRITASAGYSIETTKLDVAGAADLDRTAFAIDAAYHLGLNSLIAIGYKQVKAEVYSTLPISLHTNLSAYATDTYVGAAVDGEESTTTQLYYRVDF